MNVRWRRRTIVLVALAGLSGAAVTAAAHEGKERVPLDWKRDPRAASRRADAPVPQPPEPPAELAAPRGGADARVPPGPGARPPDRGPSVDDLALRAADEMAGEAARVWGWREYWRAGFARGVTAALDDPRLGAWDHEEGLRLGRSDPRVRAMGDHFATEAARGPADSEAEARVRAQFMDLARQPGRDRAGGSPPEGATPRFEGPFAAEPVLDEIFLASPPSRTPGLSRDGRHAIEAWRVEPTLFAHPDRGTRAYDPRWKDPAFAYATWLARQGRGSPWSRLTAVERERFRAVFLAGFQEALLRIDQRLTRDAWRDGFEDGWRYGAPVAAEWAFRRGYAEGFDAGVGQTASIAFPYAYARAYDEAYDRWFNDWAGSAHAGIGEVRLSDDNGDGVFEPGERLHVAVDVVNYGGGEGDFDLIASGNELVAPATAGVRLSGRGKLRQAQELSLRVDDRVPPRTRGTVVVSLADARADAPLYVSRPLQIEGNPAIEADRLGGRVTIAVDVSNTSRLGAPAVVRLEPLSGSGRTKESELGVIPAGGRARATLAYEGIHPLDLIGAESRWRAVVLRGGTADDRTEVRLAPVATDLSNPDLMDFMVALSRTPDISRSDVEDARALMMDRLRADWARAADASGNPYKRDYEAEGSETVLGELVRVGQAGRRSSASPQVFDGLGHAVAVLADDLPGAHPLLRKWMKKLAGRLD